MPDETLQAAFEIKTTCDEISRKLLRWHWEKKPGAHSLNALLEHIAQRQQESPEYYERMPDLSGKTSWSQLDTTLCMRVLLDPEKDAARPLDLLGNTERPATRPLTPRTAPPGHRRPSSSTRPWRRWKRATRAQLCAPRSWSSITGWPKTFWTAAARKSPLQARHRKSRRLPRAARDPAARGSAKLLVPAARAGAAALRMDGGTPAVRAARTRTAAARGAASAQKSPAPITRCWACWRRCWPWGCCCAGLG